MNTRIRKTAIGLVLVVSAGVTGAVGAHGMQDGGSEYMAQGGMMGHGSMMGGGYGGMSGGGMGMPGGGMMYGGDMGAPMGGMMGPMHGGGMGSMYGMELDSEQQTQLRELRSEHRRQQMGRMADMMDLQDEMYALMASERPDPDAVRELHDRMSAMRGEMLADQIRQRNRMQDVLTDEQREQLREGRDGQRGMMMQNGPGSREDMPMRQRR